MENELKNEFALKTKNPDIIKMWQRLGLNTMKIRNDNYKW